MWKERNRIYVLIVKALQRHIVVQTLFVHIVMKNEPGRSEGPLLRYIDPTS